MNGGTVNGRSAPAPDSRLLELDALRGIAAAVVMVFHYTTQYQELFGHVQPPTLTVPWGRYGVQLFFVISGFVIFLTLTRARSWWDFAANRFSRLYPPYWTCVAITFATLALFPVPGLNVGTGDALVNLTMLEYWFGRPMVDGVYHTLVMELAFYAFVSVLYLVGVLRRVEAWVTLWLGVIFAVNGAVHFGMDTLLVHQMVHTLHLQSPMIRTTLLIEHGHFFFAGVLFYRIKQEGGTALRWLLVIACIVAAWFVRDSAHALALAVSSLLFAAFVTGRLKWISIAPLLFLGEISYPLYLLHQNIGYAMIMRLEKAGFTSQAWLVIPAAVTILQATAVNMAVERPARDWLRRKWKQSSARKVLVPTS